MDNKIDRKIDVTAILILLVQNRQQTHDWTLIGSGANGLGIQECKGTVYVISNDHSFNRKKLPFFFLKQCWISIRKISLSYSFLVRQRLVKGIVVNRPCHYKKKYILKPKLKFSEPYIFATWGRVWAAALIWLVSLKIAFNFSRFN